MLPRSCNRPNEREPTANLLNLAMIRARGSESHSWSSYLSHMEGKVWLERMSAHSNKREESEAVIHVEMLLWSVDFDVVRDANCRTLSPAVSVPS